MGAVRDDYILLIFIIIGCNLRKSSEKLILTCDTSSYLHPYTQHSQTRFFDFIENNSFLALME